MTLPFPEHGEIGEIVKVVEGTILGSDFADDSQMDLPW